MMPDMMERLCERVRETWAERWATDKEEFDLEMFEPIIRAVLKELREPTKEMIVRGQGAGYDAPMEDIYKAMIDTILQEAE